jgi:hypothetical protein
MWKELEKLFHAAHNSPLSQSTATDATHNCLVDSEEMFAYVAIQISVTSSSK